MSGSHSDDKKKNDSKAANTSKTTASASTTSKEPEKHKTRDEIRQQNTRLQVKRVQDFHDELNKQQQAKQMEEHKRKTQKLEKENKEWKDRNQVLTQAIAAIKQNLENMKEKYKKEGGYKQKYKKPINDLVTNVQLVNDQSMKEHTHKLEVALNQLRLLEHGGDQKGNAAAITKAQNDIKQLTDEENNVLERVYKKQVEIIMDAFEGQKKSSGKGIYNKLQTESKPGFFAKIFKKKSHHVHAYTQGLGDLIAMLRGNQIVLDETLNERLDCAFQTVSVSRAQTNAVKKADDAPQNAKNNAVELNVIPANTVVVGDPDSFHRLMRAKMAKEKEAKEKAAKEKTATTSNVSSKQAKKS